MNTVSSLTPQKLSKKFEYGNRSTTPTLQNSSSILQSGRRDNEKGGYNNNKMNNSSVLVNPMFHQNSDNSSHSVSMLSRVVNGFHH